MVSLLLFTFVVPHITLAVAPGGKPVQSNFIKDWQDVEEGLVLYGYVKEWK
jgi:hypothetical protein